MNNESIRIRDYEILPETHSSMYLMHKYWARKPANIVSHYIQKYSREGDIVLDPFMGSGVTVLEAIFHGRLAVGVDINPMALFITRNIGRYIDIDLLSKSFEDLEKEVMNSMWYNHFYILNCPFCENPSQLTHIIWKRTDEDKEKITGENATSLPERLINEAQIIEVRYECKNCGKKRLSLNDGEYKERDEPIREKINVIWKKIIEDEKKAETLLKRHFPRVSEFSFSYPNQKNFLQLRHSLRKEPFLLNLFTKRALFSLLSIQEHIKKLNVDSPIQSLLLFTYSSSIAQASKMVWVIQRRKGRKLKKREVGSWTHHFFWDPNEYFEVNPWHSYKQRIQKILRGKKVSNRRNLLPHSLMFNEAYDYKELSKERPVLLKQATATDLSFLPDASIDFIFTDPPYGSSIQYGELNYLWMLFLDPHNATQYLQSILNNEIIINQNQSKTIREYKEDLLKTFKELFRVLKEGKVMIVTFHSTSSKLRNSLILSALKAGFRLHQILYQAPPRVSIKSMLHYKGSPIGDYYIRFYKPHSYEKERETNMRRYDKKELEKHIQEFIEYVLKERGEATYFLFLSNFLDEELFNWGYYSKEMDTEEIEAIINKIQQNPHSKFIIKEGKWWFKNPETIEGMQPPLSQRIKAYLITLLKEERENGTQFRKQKKTYKQFYFNKIYEKFRGILTPDKWETNLLIEHYLHKREEKGEKT